MVIAAAVVNVLRTCYVPDAKVPCAVQTTTTPDPIRQSRQSIERLKYHREAAGDSINWPTEASLYP